MSKLPSVSGTRAIKVFGVHGFVCVRVAASHHILKKDGHRFQLSIPVHGTKAIKPGLLRSQIRVAGLTVEQFVETLNNL